MGVELNTLVKNAGEVQKAFVANVNTQVWTLFGAVAPRPTLANPATSPVIDTGVYECGFGREPGLNSGAPNYRFAYPAIRIYPYCEDGNATFSIRVWGWEVFRAPVMPAGVQRAETWFPVLLAELVCQGGSLIAGPTRRTDVAVTAPGTDNMMLDTEYFSEQIDVVQGVATVQSYGLGSGLVAKAIVDLGACQLFQFDFYHENAVPLGMNCFFGFAS